MKIECYLAGAVDKIFIDVENDYIKRCVLGDLYKISDKNDIDYFIMVEDHEITEEEYNSYKDHQCMENIDLFYSLFLKNITRKDFELLRGGNFEIKRDLDNHELIFKIDFFQYGYFSFVKLVNKKTKKVYEYNSLHKVGSQELNEILNDFKSFETYTQVKEKYDICG